MEFYHSFVVDDYFYYQQIFLSLVQFIDSFWKCPKYIASKNQKEFLTDLKSVYAAPSETDAYFQLEKLNDKWGDKYPLVIKSWKDNWTNLSTYFQYPQEIRTMIYTTNAVEGLHRQFRKMTKAKSLFPNDEALTKIIFLAYKDIAKKWTMPVRNLPVGQAGWSFVISQFSVIFDERLKKYL